MPFVTAGQNAALSGGIGNAITHVSLHNGDPSTTGANELTGGSPAYARKAVTWAAASGGTRSNSGALVFDVPTVATPGVAYVGFWDAITAGTFYGWFPAGGPSGTIPFAATFDAAGDAYTSYAHGLTAGMQVVVYDVQTAGLITFVEGTIYFVAGTITADTFQLSATSGGAAITTTTSFEAIIHRVIPETFAGQGTYTIPASSLVLDARFL